MPRFHRTLRAALALALGLGLLEGGLRVGAHLTQHTRGVQYHPQYGWRGIPNVSKVGPQWGRKQPGRTTSNGWRDTEWTRDKPPGTRRILCLGDSFTFGVLVDYGERFTEQLEQILPGTEVLNLGATAYGTDQELRVLEEEGLSYRPDIVVVTAFLGNDLEDIRYEKRFGWPKPRYRLNAGELELIEPEWSLGIALRSSFYLGEIAARALDRFRPRSVFAQDVEAAEAPELFVALTQRMAALSRQHDAHFLVVLVYSQYRREKGGPNEREREVLERLEAAGIHALDTIDLFTYRWKADDDYARDGHWNAQGHAKLARALEAELRSRGWLDDP